MKGTYDVYFGSDVIGKAVVERIGLYYRFQCSCRLTGEVMCRLTVTCGKNQANLGVLIPTGDCFGLTTKLSVKKLGEGSLRFRVLPKHSNTEGRFVPVYPDEPFAYLTRLQNAVMQLRDGQAGVLLSAQASSNPTGQWSEPIYAG